MKFFDWIWIFYLNKNACLTNKIWFFVLFEECIYECMKLWLNMNFWFEWKCMFECMKFDFLFFLKSALMNAWNFVNFLNENACMNAWILFVILILFCFFSRMYSWMHKTWFFFVLLFLKNAYMNAWNLIFFILNENTCLNAWNFIFNFLG